MTVEELHYKNRKHLKTRLITLIILLLPFVLFGILHTETPREFNGQLYPQRSCLGNPAVLPYAFVGVPLLLILALVDILILAILKKINWYKVCINLSIALIIFLSAFLLPF